MKISGPKCSGFVSPAKDTLVVAEKHREPDGPQPTRWDPQNNLQNYQLLGFF